jgi:lipoprotein-anchoring transpeptidase ErfK/SrfK
MRWLLNHRRIVAGVAGPFVLALVLAAAAYGYDRSQSDVIAKGVHIGSVDVGGLDAHAARAKLKAAFRPLRRPLVLRHGEGRIVLTPRQTRVSVNLDALVHQATARSRRGWFGPRAWRELTGGTVTARLQPRIRYSWWTVRHTVRQLQDRLDRPARNAKLRPSFDRLTVVKGRHGREVQKRRLRSMIRTALVSRHASRIVRVPTEIIKPKVTVTKLQHKNPSYITIDRGAFTLRVYQNLKLVKSYPIAVGQAGLETPEGVYHVQDKQIDPSWHVPLSAWAGSLAGQIIPPGPSDPLKSRWMGIFNGAGIHGTAETWSIGHAVSHGCVRMLIPDVIDLYDRVEVGTPVYIGD